jgi:hypothetical protein
MVPGATSRLSEHRSPPASRFRHLLAIFGGSTIHRERFFLVAAIVLFCVYALADLATKRPWCDEAWFADMAYNLANHGVMGTRVLDPHGFPFAALVKGIDRYTYWVMPCYIFLVAAWSKIVGISPFAMRSLSVLWGVVALLSWYYLVQRLTMCRTIAILSVFVLGVEQHFVLAGATGRMDMMCVALCLAASAVYLGLRDHFHRAVFIASCILSAALLTHPNALFGGILLGFIVLFLDRDRLDLRAVLVALLPFVIGLGLWTLYILKAPDILVSQMQAQAGLPRRLHFEWNLFRQVWDEWTGRYVLVYRLNSTSPWVRLTGSVVFVYFLSVAALATIPALRRQRSAKLVLALAVADFALLSCLQTNWYYLVYILPVYATAVAFTVAWLWQHGPVSRWIAASIISGVVLLNSATTGFRVVRNDYKNQYLPVVHYLAQHASPNSQITGSAELAFNLGFDGRILDDCRLGFTSGRVPDYIVVEAFYETFWFPWFSVNEPKTFRYVVDLLGNGYELVYTQSHDRYGTLGLSGVPYKVFKRRASTK